MGQTKQQTKEFLAKMRGLAGPEWVYFGVDDDYYIRVNNYNFTPVRRVGATKKKGLFHTDADKVVGYYQSMHRALEAIKRDRVVRPTLNDKGKEYNLDDYIKRVKDAENWFDETAQKVVDETDGKIDNEMTPAEARKQLLGTQTETKKED